jgi:hypothetical protein
VIYSFLRHPHLSRVVGVELAPSRAAIAIAAIRKLAQILPKYCIGHTRTSFLHFLTVFSICCVFIRSDPRYSNVSLAVESEEKLPSPILHSVFNETIFKLPKSVRLDCTFTDRDASGIVQAAKRSLEFRWGDLFNTKDAAQADIIVLQTGKQTTPHTATHTSSHVSSSDLHVRRMQSQLPVPDAQGERRE